MGKKVLSLGRQHPFLGTLGVAFVVAVAAWTGLYALACSLPPTTYRLSVAISPSASGGVTPNLNPTGGTYASPGTTDWYEDYVNNTTVILTATPASGKMFDRWEGSLTGSTNPASVSMTAARSVTAYFVNAYALTTSVTGSGTVSPTAGTYKQGTSVTITATPSTNWVFDHWEGALSGANNPQSLTMTADVAVTAVFLPTFTVTTEVEGEGTAVVSPVQARYAQGTNVTLTATPVAHWGFSHWEEDDTYGEPETVSVENPHTFAATANRTLRAVFRPLYALTVEVDGNGAVTPNGGEYLPYTSVPLEATPADGWEFDHWEGSITTWGLRGTATGHRIGTTAIVMSQPQTIKAVFRYGYTLTVTVNGEGTVTPVSGVYAPGSTVTLTAISDATGSGFSHWSDDVTEAFSFLGSTTGVNPLTVTMIRPRNITAHFDTSSPLPGRSLVNVMVEGEGTISPPGGWVDACTFTATPAVGWRFKEWEWQHFVDNSLVADVLTDNPLFLPYSESGSILTARFVRVFGLTVVPTEGGTVDVTPPGATHDEGAPVTLTPIPEDEHWRFHHWEGDVSGTGPLTIVIEDNLTVRPVFVRLFGLARTVVGGGTIAATPDAETYDEGTEVHLVATPTEGWRFARWEGDAAATTPEIDVTTDAAKAVTAVFIKTYELDTSTVGDGSVYPASGVYDLGKEVKVTATPDQHWTFVRWNGDVTTEAASNREVTLTMDADKTLEAVFGHTLTVYVTPGGGVHLGASQDTMRAPGGVRALSATATAVLTALPDTGYTFARWIAPPGAVINGATLELPMGADATVSAVFEAVDGSVPSNHNLDLRIQGEGSIAVSVPATTVTDHAVLSLAPNATPVLTATAAEGWEFVGWSGDASGATSPITVTMDGPKGVTARFKETGTDDYGEYDLTVRVVGQGVVETAGTRYPADDLALLVAKPSFGWRFDHWEGNATETLNVTGVLMDANKTVTAVFVAPALTLTLPEGVDGGHAYVGDEEAWVPGDPGLFNAGWAPGAVVTVTAVPEPGWVFSHWEGDTAGINPLSASVQVTMGQHRMLVPVFLPLLPLSVVVAGGGSVQVSVDGTVVGTATADAAFLQGYVPDSIVTLTPTAQAWYEFMGYGGFGVEPDPATGAVTFPIQEPALPMAQFGRKQHTVTVTVDPEAKAEVLFAPAQETYSEGSMVEIAVYPVEGAVFDHWEGDFVTLDNRTDNPIRLTVTGDIAATAKLHGAYQLLTETDGQGTIEISGASVDGYYFGDETVALTAVPAEGWRFDRWGKDALGAEPETEVAMASNKLVRARFVELEDPGEPLYVSLRHYRAGVACNDCRSVDVTYTPEAVPPVGEWVRRDGGIEEIALRFAPNAFEFGTPRAVVRLRAVAAGDTAVVRHLIGTSGGNVYGSTVAYDTEIARYGTGNHVIDGIPHNLMKYMRFVKVTVESEHGQVSYGGSSWYMPSYSGLGGPFLYTGSPFRWVVAVPGQRGAALGSVAVRAYPGWLFDGWEVTGDCEYVAGTSIFPDYGALYVAQGDNTQDLHFVARYVPDPTMTKTLDLDVVGSGEASATPQETEYGHGALVTATATPAEGWRFLQWQSGTEVMSLSPDYRFAITEHTQLTAVFEEDPAAHPLRVHVLGRGRVDRGAGNADSATAYAHGTIVDLNAVPDDGWAFDHWEGNAVIDAQHPADAIVQMDGPKAVTAVFKPYVDISVDINDDGVYLAEDGIHTHPDDEALEDTDPELMRTEDNQNNGLGYRGVQAYLYVMTDDYQPVHVAISDDFSPTATVEVNVDTHEDDFSFHRGPYVLNWGGLGNTLTSPWPLSRGRYPTDIYVIAHDALDELEEEPEVTLTVTVHDPAIPDGAVSDSVRLRVVRKVGDLNYFGAARDYMIERDTKYFTRIEQIIRGGGSLREDYRVVVMRKENTSIKALEYGSSPIGPHRISSVPLYPSAWSCDVIVNGVFFPTDTLLTLSPRVNGDIVWEHVLSPVSRGNGEIQSQGRMFFVGQASSEEGHIEFHRGRPTMIDENGGAFEPEVGWPGNAAETAGITSPYFMAMSGLHDYEMVPDGGYDSYRDSNMLGPAHDARGNDVIFLAMTTNKAMSMVSQRIVMMTRLEASGAWAINEDGQRERTVYRMDGASSCGMYLRGYGRTVLTGNVLEDIYAANYMDSVIMRKRHLVGIYEPVNNYLGFEIR